MNTEQVSFRVMACLTWFLVYSRPLLAADTEYGGETFGVNVPEIRQHVGAVSWDEAKPAETDMSFLSEAEFSVPSAVDRWLLPGTPVGRREDK